MKTFASGLHAGPLDVSVASHLAGALIITEAGGVRLTENRPSDEAHLRYALADRLGSVGCETDGAGNVTSREEYYSYGGSAGSDEEKQEVHDRTRRYSGRERDATGLIYYGWRYYQPEAGRWLSADPGGLIDGANLFLFCRCNPVMLSDADGRAPKDEVSEFVTRISMLSHDVLEDHAGAWFLLCGDGGGQLRDYPGLLRALHLSAGGGNVMAQLAVGHLMDAWHLAGEPDRPLEGNSLEVAIGEMKWSPAASLYSSSKSSSSESSSSESSSSVRSLSEDSPSSPEFSPSEAESNMRDNPYMQQIALPPGGEFNSIGMIERTDVVKLYRAETDSRADDHNPLEWGFMPSREFYGLKKMMDDDVLIAAGSFNRAHFFGSGNLNDEPFTVYEIDTAGVPVVSVRENMRLNAQFMQLRNDPDVQIALEFDEFHISNDYLSREKVFIANSRKH